MNKEWNVWEGGQCPTYFAQRVDYRLRNGTEGEVAAWQLAWPHNPARPEVDVVAWRLAEAGAPQQACQTDAPAILRAAAGHIGDRAVTYDKPAGERSVPAVVEAFAAITGVRMTPEQGWLFLVLLKVVRSQQGAYKGDNYEDLAAYAALMGEAAACSR